MIPPKYQLMQHERQFTEVLPHNLNLNSTCFEIKMIAINVLFS